MPLSDMSVTADANGAFCLFHTSCEQQRNMLKSPYSSGFPKKHVGSAARPANGRIH
jgi:hypothetical protein